MLRELRFGSCGTLEIGVLSSVIEKITRIPGQDRKRLVPIGRCSFHQPVTGLLARFLVGRDGPIAQSERSTSIEREWRWNRPRRRADGWRIGVVVHWHEGPAIVEVTCDLRGDFSPAQSEWVCRV